MGIYIFLFLVKNLDCGYLLERPRRGGSNEYPQSMFWAEIRKIIAFFLPDNFQFFGVKFFSIYLNRHVLVMMLVFLLFWSYDTLRYMRPTKTNPRNLMSTSAESSADCLGPVNPTHTASGGSDQAAAISKASLCANILNNIFSIDGSD